jgi:hypothetical protein
VKFDRGDLVMLKGDTTVYYSLEAASNVGIVVSKAVLMYAHQTHNGEKIKFYAYDVMFDGRTYKNVPEEVLRGLENDNEENIK